MPVTRRDFSATWAESPRAASTSSGSAMTLASTASGFSPRAFATFST